MMEPSNDESAAKNRIGCFWSLLAVGWLLLKWSFIGVASIAGMLKLWSVLDPPKPLIISRETTLITEPLAEDGLPDYARFVLDRQREGVTPENNGAIPFWQAMGPSNIDQEYHEILFDEIGTPIPAGKDSLKKLSDDETRLRVGKWLASEWGEEDFDEKELMDLADELIADARRHPWEDVSPSPLAAWAVENNAALDLLVEASRKPKFYSPYPNLLTDPPDSLIDVLLYASQESRDACPSLAIRAMYRIEKGDFRGAWRDLEATIHLADHIAQGEESVSLMVGIASRQLAYNVLKVWLQEVNDPKLVRSVLSKLQQQPESFGLPGAMVFDSMMLLDNAIRMFSPSRESRDIDIQRFGHALDINAACLYIRSWQIRIIEIANTEDRATRRRQWKSFEYELDALAKETKGSIVRTRALLSRTVRSQTISKILVSLMTPGLGRIAEAEDHSVDQLRLARTAAALTVWRLKQGDYPDRLEQLVPDLLPELPVDASWGKPFHYERRGEGYLLYAVGTDGEDNGGDNRDGTIIDGEWILDEESDKVTGGVDLVIRLPIPELRLPAPPE